MNPIVQYVLKALIVAAGLAMAATGHLSIPLAGLLSSGLLALGVTNGASIIAQASQLGTAVTPPPPAVNPPAVATAVATLIGAALAFFAVMVIACSGYPAPTSASAMRDIRAVCAAVQVLDAPDAGAKADGAP